MVNTKRYFALPDMHSPPNQWQGEALKYKAAMAILTKRYVRRSEAGLRNSDASASSVRAWSERSWGYPVRQSRTSRPGGITSPPARYGNSRRSFTATLRISFPMYRTVTGSRKSIQTRLLRKEGRKRLNGRKRDRITTTLARQYGVSEDAMRFRLMNLNSLTAR